MQALNQAYEDVGAFREMMKKAVQEGEQPAPRNISAEVAAWNAKVDREKFEKEQMKKIARRSAAERLTDTL